MLAVFWSLTFEHYSRKNHVHEASSSKLILFVLCVERGSNILYSKVRVRVNPKHNAQKDFTQPHN